MNTIPETGVRMVGDPDRIFFSGYPSDEYIKWAKDSSVVMASFPRSGTNLLLFFMELLDLQFLHSQIDYKILSKKPLAGWEGVLYEGLGLKYYVCGHLYCPGYSMAFSKDVAKEWKKLNPYKPEINDVNYNEMIETFSELSYPQYNEKVKIIYLYRNPLDQIVSMAKHFSGHVDNKSHEMTSCNNPDYAESWSCSYLRSFITYDSVRKMYPDNVMMIPYEDMMRDMQGSLEKIVKFMGVDISGERTKLFSDTVDLVRPENMKKIEQARGKTLAGDQVLGPESNNSHLRGGEIGKWRKNLTDETLRKYEIKFKQYGYDLNSFEGIDGI